VIAFPVNDSTGLRLVPYFGRTKANSMEMGAGEVQNLGSELPHQALQTGTQVPVISGVILYLSDIWQTTGP